MIGGAISRSAPAKLNLTLEVVARLPSGYHRIRSVFVRCDKLADTIRIRIDPRGSAIRIETDAGAVPADATNTCHVAAAAYLAAIRQSCGIDISIEKRIPVAAGLGGGSSDAAAVLVTLNEHFGCPLSDRRMVALASDVGKDVPFFVRGDPASHVSGMGEVMRTLPALPDLHFLLIDPRLPVSTRDAYNALDAQLWFMADETRSDRSRAMLRAIRARDALKMAAALYNDFEAAVARMHPVVVEMKQALEAFGALGASMSGSGATVFGLFDSTRSLRSASDALRKRYASFAFASV